MPTKPVHLQSRVFATRGKATEFFRQMLGRYEDGETLSQEDSQVLHELLRRHPRALEKIGGGVASFSRERGEKPTSGFHIRRVDNTHTDFSYLTCIDGELRSLESEFYSACQAAVSEELRSEKAAWFKAHGNADGRVLCSETGELVAIDECDYRHTRPRFKEIVNDFIAASNIVLTPEILAPSRDLQYGSQIVDESVRENFCTFHREHRHMAIIKRRHRYREE